jgi:hypothetical protein
MKSIETSVVISEGVEKVIHPDSTLVFTSLANKRAASLVAPNFLANESLLNRILTEEHTHAFSAKRKFTF